MQIFESLARDYGLIGAVTATIITTLTYYLRKTKIRVSMNLDYPANKNKTTDKGKKKIRVHVDIDYSANGHK